MDRSLQAHNSYSFDSASAFRTSVNTSVACSRATGKKYPTVSESYLNQRMSGQMIKRASVMAAVLQKRNFDESNSITHGTGSLTNSVMTENYEMRANLNKTYHNFRSPRYERTQNPNILISDKLVSSPRIGNSMVMGRPKLKKKPIEYQYFPYLKKPADKYSID